jgi:hypothetical protein
VKNVVREPFAACEEPDVVAATTSSVTNMSLVIGDLLER